MGVAGTRGRFVAKVWAMPPWRIKPIILNKSLKNKNKKFVETKESVE